ncbi:hypothetical protein MJO29_010319 [Puccinia striiformis f. sp. tritici]|uniref:hypothetical protein n=1 Tax=Puccinia striiformis f. sp. tritici TaxID=168172 RepID=UPI002007CEDC|nr:hypothetical protein Pst134EA_019385 [Puccinia striiformis f. sp. tritici]KAH9459235.1 hypothetical protein Pst134EA_019385 [Puccinia striiformis f. sp. tritici]KAI7948654.1 hypothetical protein MJO29_010319 [Puccinia striiformis f. sp. tritici]
MSTTTFRPSACPSYWTLFLFHLTTPSIPDAWRNWLSSQEYSSPRIYAVMLTVHRSIKAIYGLVIWLIRFRSATYHHSQNSSELSRALNDGLDHQIRNARARKMYRDDEDSNEETRALLASSSNGNDPHQDTENEEHPLSNLVVWRVAWIINHSKQLQTTKLALTSDDSTDPKELTEAIVAIKNINPIFSTTLVECLKRIQSASNTRLIIEERSKLAYKTELHRDKFKELLKLLKPDQDYETLPPKGWQEIGFQGTDPSTDLRGAGLLGLDALIVFGRYFGSIGQEIVTEAIEGGSSWYPWALASINITWWCVRLSKDRQLDYFLLIQSSCKSDDRQESLMKDIPIELYEFLILQSRLTLLFHRFWMDLKPRPSVMDFEIKFKIFQKRVQLGLRRGFIGGLGLGWILDPSSPDFTHQQTIVKF